MLTRILILIPVIGTVFDTMLFVLVPELLTEYYIVKISCNYNQASRFIYGPVLHTTHHVFFGFSVFKCSILTIA